MKKEQQPAFPQDDIYLYIPKEISEKYPGLIGQLKVHGKGMTLRQWYAGKALQGILSSPNMRTPIGNDVIAKGAFAYADAMIAFEEKEGKE